MALASTDRIRVQLEELVGLLKDQRIVSCQNRKGLRKQTGILLEDAFLELAVAMSPDLSVEIGAHEASFSVRIKQACPRVQALAFEANPYVYEKYLNALPLQMVEYRNAAISDRNETATLYIPTRWSGGSFGKANAISSLSQRNDDRFDYETVTVPSYTLDEVLHGVDYGIAVAWIDVEGGQREVIEGAKEFLSRAAAVYIEVETTEVWRGQKTATDVSQCLEANGFVTIMRDNLADLQFNEVYVRNREELIALAGPVLIKYVEEVRSLLVS